MALLMEGEVLLYTPRGARSLTQYASRALAHLADLGVFLLVKVPLLPLAGDGLGLDHRGAPAVPLALRARALGAAAAGQNPRLWT